MYCSWNNLLWRTICVIFFPGTRKIWETCYCLCSQHPSLSWRVMLYCSQPVIASWKEAVIASHSLPLEDSTSSFSTFYILRELLFPSTAALYISIIHLHHSPTPSSPSKINNSLSSSQLLQTIIAGWFSPAISKHLKVLWLWEMPWLWERLRFLTELSFFQCQLF